MKLIPNWRDAWRMFSVQAQLWTSVLLGSWGALPDDLKSRLPEHLVIYMAIGLLVFGIIGRLVYQPTLHEPQGPK